MSNITKANVSDFTITGEWTIAAAIKPEQGSTESKQVTLKFNFVNVPLVDVIASSLKDKRINWQVGGRKKFNEIKGGSVIAVNYSGGRTPVDPELAAKSFFASLTPEARAEFIKQLTAKAEPTQEEMDKEDAIDADDLNPDNQ